MQIDLAIDLQSAIQKAVSPEALQPIIDKAIQSAVSSAINDATGYRSKFSEALKTQMAEALPHGLGADDMVKFQHVLNGVITKLVGEANTNTIRTAFDHALKAVMPEVPAVVKLSAFMEIARDGFHKEKHEAFYAFWKPSEFGGGGWLYLDKDEKPGHSSSYSTYSAFDRDDAKYKASFRLAVTEDGAVYALHMDGKVVTPVSLPDVISQFDTTLMAMYVGRTRLEIDIDDDDVAAAASEQYED